MKRESYNSDTMKAFLYLARKKNHKEFKYILQQKFKDCDFVSLAKDDYYCVIHEMSSTAPPEKCAGVYLTLHGIALANEITTNNSNRFFNKAAFVVSIISLLISLMAAVFSVLPFSPPDSTAGVSGYNPVCSCDLLQTESDS